MSFGQRLQQANEAEVRVATYLRDDGWTVSQFGQALLPEAFREALKSQQDNYGRPSLVRWFPDLIVFKRVNLKIRVVLLDVKADKPERDRWAIEIKAIETCEMFQNSLFTLCWFIFDDGKLSAMTPEMVRDHGIRAGFQGVGSGTPFVVVDKTAAKNINQILVETV